MCQEMLGPDHQRNDLEATFERAGLTAKYPCKVEGLLSILRIAGEDQKESEHSIKFNLFLNGEKVAFPEHLLSLLPLETEITLKRDDGCISAHLEHTPGPDPQPGLFGMPVKVALNPQADKQLLASLEMLMKRFELEPVYVPEGSDLSSRIAEVALEIPGAAPYRVTADSPEVLTIKSADAPQRLDAYCRASQAVEKLLGALVAEIDLKNYTLQGRFRQAMDCLLTGDRNPLAVRSLLQQVNTEVLPLFREAAVPVGHTLSDAEQALVYPLVDYHPDEPALLAKIKNLKHSPDAALTFFAANTAHVRFSHYDRFDVLVLPELLNVILPRFDELLKKAEDSRRGGLIGENGDFAALERYVRALSTGFVMLADHGAFSGHSKIGWKWKSVGAEERQLPIDKILLGLFGTDSQKYIQDISVHGDRILELFKRAHTLCPDLISVNPPEYLEFRNARFASQEIEEIGNFNRDLPYSSKISLSDVLFSSSSEARRYRETRIDQSISHIKFDETEKIRTLWKKLFGFFTGEKPTFSEVLPCPAGLKAYNRAFVFFEKNRVEGNTNSLFSQAAIWLHRLPPPADHPEFEDYLRKGEILVSNLEAFKDGQEQEMSPTKHSQFNRIYAWFAAYVSALRA